MGLTKTTITCAVFFGFFCFILSNEVLADSAEDFRYCVCDSDYDVQLYNKKVYMGELGTYDNKEECMVYLQRNPSCKVVNEVTFEQPPEIPLTYCTCDTDHNVNLYVDREFVQRLGDYDTADRCIDALERNPGCQPRFGTK